MIRIHSFFHPIPHFTRIFGKLLIHSNENFQFITRASYLEIYNEEIRDLLSANTKQKLDIKESPGRGVYVKGNLTFRHVETGSWPESHVQ